MKGLKKGSFILVLISGIIETIVAFVAYWVFYAIAKANDTSLVTPMVLLLFGMLGGILAIIGSVLLKYTKIGGAVLCAVAAGLQLFATLYLVVKIGSGTGFGDAVMIILPFFILPNALSVAGAIMAFVPNKDETPAPTPDAKK